MVEKLEGLDEIRSQVFDYLKYKRDDRAIEMFEDDQEEINEWNEDNPIFGKSDDELLELVNMTLNHPNYEEYKVNFDSPCDLVWEMICHEDISL